MAREHQSGNSAIRLRPNAEPGNPTIRLSATAYRFFFAAFLALPARAFGGVFFFATAALTGLAALADLTGAAFFTETLGARAPS